MQKNHTFGGSDRILSGKAMLVLFSLLFVLAFAKNVSAAPRAGWNVSKNGTRVRYYQQQKDGSLKRLTGLTKIGTDTFYFSKKGILQTGWRKISGTKHYFEKTGDVGVRGKMAVGWKKIGRNRYYFRKSSGILKKKITPEGTIATYSKTGKVLKVTREDVSGETPSAGGSTSTAGTVSYGTDRWGKLLTKYAPDSKTNQLLFVKYTGGSKADIEFYVKKNGVWKRNFHSKGYVGKRGIAKVREGDMKTPTGTYTLFSGFGQAADPGTTASMPYVHVNRYMYYCADLSYYNQLVDTSKSDHKVCSGEHLSDAKYAKAYEYGMFLSYNSRHVYKKGSAIFLHCKGYNPYTAGCIAIDRSKMIRVLRTVTEGAKICIYKK